MLTYNKESFLISYILLNCSNKINSVHVKNNKIIIFISPIFLRFIIQFLLKSMYLKADNLLDIWVTDYPDKDNRFEVSYLFVSVKFETRIILKSVVSEYTYIDSVCDLCPSANWLEREAWDLYGVLFLNHPDLRRILTDYGFSGHPLRKDFPLTGYNELRYDDSEKRVVVELLEASQEFRLFTYTAPWQIV